MFLGLHKSVFVICAVQLRWRQPAIYVRLRWDLGIIILEQVRASGSTQALTARVYVEIILERVRASESTQGLTIPEETSGVSARTKPRYVCKSVLRRRVQNLVEPRIRVESHHGSIFYFC